MLSGASWLLGAVLAFAIAHERMGVALHPNYGGIPRALMLALARTPELFALAAVLAMATWTVAVRAACGSSGARRSADFAGAVLFVAFSAAVLAVLPPPLQTLEWVSATEIVAFAHARAIFSVGVLALLVQVSIVALADVLATRSAGWRVALGNPSVFVLIAWAALGARVRFMWWSWRQDGQPSEHAELVCGIVLALAVTLFVVGVALARRRRSDAVSAPGASLD